MLRLVLRPLLVLLTFAALLVALIQVTGRLAMALLGDLEPAVNRVLDSRGIVVTGLTGDWRMLDPVIRVRRVELPGASLQGVLVEVDMVASVLRGTLLARRLRVRDARIELEKAPGQPWRLAGGSGAGGLDMTPLLWHSDQLEAAGRVRFHRVGGATDGIRFDYLGVNRGGEHRHELRLDNAPRDCADANGCRLELRVRNQEALWPLHQTRMRISARGERFLVPRALLGFSPVLVASLDAGWQRIGEVSAGAGQLRAEQFDMPGAVTLASELHAAVRGHGAEHHGAVSEWRVEDGSGSWLLPAITVDADADGAGARLSQLDLARVSDFLHRALGAVEPVDRWLGALNLHGTAHNVRAHYRFDDGELGYAMTLDGVSMDGFKGTPTVRAGAGELIGYGRGLQVNVNAADMTLRFPDLFTGTWGLPYAQGAIQAWFGRDYFGVRGLNLRAETSATRAAGEFAVTRPPDREGQRLWLLMDTDRISVPVAQQFVSYRLPDDVRQWLLNAPLDGVLEQATLAFQGQFNEAPGELARRLELRGRIRDGQVRYDPEWPEVKGLDGMLTVAGQTVEVAVRSAVSAGARLAASRVRVAGGTVDMSLDADIDATDLLAFVRTTPLARWVRFVEPDWRADGPLRVSGELSVPLPGQDGVQATEPAVRLRADLDGVNVALPGYRIALDTLTGSVRYRFPFQVDATGIDAVLFGAPVRVSANTDSDGDTVHLRLRGRATPQDVWRVADFADPGLASGAFDFDADLALGTAEGGPGPRLVVRSDLAGLALDLPGGLGKRADEPRAAEVRLSFQPQEPSLLEFAYEDAGGWLQFADEPLRGAIGFDAVAAEPNPAASDLVLGGRLAALDLDDVLPDADGSPVSPLPLRLDDLEIGSIDVAGFAVTGATLTGTVDRDGLELKVSSDQLVGRFERHGDAPLAVDLAQLAVMPTQRDSVIVASGDAVLPIDALSGDPLDVSLIGRLPAADVTVAALSLGSADYGTWRFDLRPDGDVLRVERLEATLRGVTIRATEPLAWRGDRNETRFSGSLEGGNLADVLTQWGYAPSVESASATLRGEFTWSGSPVAVDMLQLRGHARAEATDGRFVEVEAGAGSQRIFSLLNFANIAKRLALNFSDVFGRGVSFDQITTDFTLDRGHLSLVEPMEVKGTGSRFRVTGTVNLASGELDNDMVVTLPVTQSLPWYAAYVALANPLAGLGVLVGERMLRKPLEQFSSAKYHIGGTLDVPEVKFVSVFDTATPSQDATVGEGEGSPADENGAAATP